MEYIIVIFIGIGFFSVVIGREIYSQNQKKKKFIMSLRDNYGELPKKDYSLDRFAKINSYYERHRSKNQIDDITWNDLDMDRIFRMMDKTFSASGEEYLYYKLRTPVREKEELEVFETLTSYFEKEEENRVKVQVLMNQLGHTGKYSLYDYLENLETLGKRSNAKHLAADALYLAGIGIMAVNFSTGLLFLAVLMVCNIISYYRERAEMEPFMVSFAYLSRLLTCAKEIASMKIDVLEEENRLFLDADKKIGKINKGAWFVFSGARMGTSSNPMDLIFDYLKMIFHPDIMIFNNMLHTVKINIRKIDAVIGAVGRIECAIAVGNWRKYLDGKWCRPEIGLAEQMIFDEIYHPELTDPVDNTLAVSNGKGVLITGSNASGKSTFLRTVALNFLLGQTVNTCTANRVCMPLVRLFSSMSLRDDLIGGESYYMAEIRSIKRILDACREEGNHLVCFVDEVLRGTNTPERIAASTEILFSLCGKGKTCFAATHDIELTELLCGSYDNYHFEELISGEDISFSYKIMRAKANSSNAIQLLKIMGYDSRIIKRAKLRLENFLKSGNWAENS